MIGSDKIDTKDWSDADRAALAALERELLEEQEAADARELAAQSPAAIIAEKKAELGARKEARQVAERDAAEDIIFEKLCSENGGPSRMARVRTLKGSVMLRAMTLREVDTASAASEGVSSATDKVRVHRRYLADTVKHPPEARFRELIEEFPGLWAELYEARDALISGVQKAAEGKG